MQPLHVTIETAEPKRTGNISQIQPWAIYSLILVSASLSMFGTLFDELSINESVSNPYDQNIILKCGWKSVTILIDSEKYVKKYSYESTIKAGRSYLTWKAIGLIMVVLIFIPKIVYYIPLCTCLRCIKKWKISMIRFGTLLCGIIWIVAAVDWTTTEDCCEYWHTDFEPWIEYEGTDCAWYISIYASLAAAFLSLLISFYSICIWDITCFEQFSDDDYYHMV